MVFGWLVRPLGLLLYPAVPLAALSGATLGFITGVTVVKSGVHSFIITLASMRIFFGGMIFLTKAAAHFGLPPEVAAFGKMRFFDLISPLLLISVAVCGGLVVFYRLTTPGRQMPAAGANPRKAALSGIRTGRVMATHHVFTGLLAGLLVTARTGSAVLSMAGQSGLDWLLPAVLAPDLGGTLLSGGRVSVLGILLGATFVNVMTSGLLLMRVGSTGSSALQAGCC